MTRRIQAALCGVLAAATVAVAALVPASAAAAGAYIGRSAWLTLPAPANNPTACTGRTIDLDPGVYRWSLHLQHWAHPSVEQRAREILLAGGRYTWTDCMDPFGPPIGWGFDYNHISTLYPPAGAAPATLLYQMGAGWGDGTYYYGSRLVWLRP